MKYEVRFTHTAERDLHDIYEYVAYELEEFRMALRLIDRFREATERLSISPEKNRAVDEDPWRSRNTRYAIVGYYLMFYTVDKKEQIVNVIRVAYGGRDLRAQLARLLGEAEAL